MTMLDRILLGLHEVEGVQATMVVDSGGRILASRAHAVYDMALIQQVGRSIVNAVDSVQLVQDDWELLIATFAEGKVLIRNLAGRSGRTVVLAVVADGRLNPSFAGVAIRVAASKLRAELESPTAVSGVVQAVPGQMPQAPSAPVPMPVSQHMPAASMRSVPPIPASAAIPPLPLRAELSGSGLSWSGVSKSLGQSSVATSGVSVVDGVASGFLTACTKALSGSVGPMAKVFIKEAVRRICPDRPFAREDGPALVAELEQHIDDPAERNEFRRALRSA
jgi:predicted regulator of Ras-like GTPase activity (Roadblock/LC7/MglB family)